MCVFGIRPARSPRHVALTYLKSLPRSSKTESDNLSPAISVIKENVKTFHEKQADVLKSELPLGPAVWERGFESAAAACA